MNIYKATANGKSLVTVIAKNPEDAREKIESALNKSGRYAYYKIWLDDGEKIEIKK